MLNLNNYPTNRFSPVYQLIVNSLYVDCGDEKSNSHSPLLVLEGTEKLIKEELVRCIWFGQHIKKDNLYADDGSRLEILSPGRWNSEGGPDFKHAEILMEGKGLVKGNVEVHVFASDWMRHQHDKQETYNTVCLHIAMWNDTEGKRIKNSMGQLIPQLTLSKYLDAELDDVIDMIDVESYLRGGKVNPGHCQIEIESQKIDEQWIGHFLDYAGDERILQKAKRYEKWVESRPLEQILYEAVMESLGYKDNKEPFLMLASRTPLEDIRYLIPEDAPIQEKKIHVQALLLGMAGLLPQQRNLKPTADKETVGYRNDIEHAWNTIKTKTGKVSMTKNDWTYAGTRPANFPERRIAAMTNILAESPSYGIFRHILCVFQKLISAEEQDIKICEENAVAIKTIADGIQSLFLDIHDPFWSYHYTIGGKRLKKPQKLLGKERTSHIFINVIIPVLLVYARRHSDIKLEKILHLVYRNYKSLPSTSVTKFMEHRVLGQSKRSSNIVNSARRQQGLYQIFKDFCENDNISCNKCALYLSMVKR